MSHHWIRTLDLIHDTIYIATGDPITTPVSGIFYFKYNIVPTQADKNAR